MNEIGFSNKITAALDLIAVASAAVVTSAEEHAAADLHLKNIRSTEKALDDDYKSHEIIVAAKQMQSIKGDLADRLEKTRKAVKARQIAWEDAQEAIRVAEERRLASEAKKRQEEEALAQAKEAQDAGHKDAAIAVLEEAITAPAPVVVIPRTAPKTANRRTIPRFRIIDVNLIPRQYMMPNEVAIGGVIRSLKAAANIPGISYYEGTI